MANNPYLRHAIVNENHDVSIRNSCDRDIRDYPNLVKYRVSVH